jgi:hypothetical protein
VRPAVNTLVVGWIALAALSVTFPTAARAQGPERAPRAGPGREEGDDLWVPSLAATSGVLLQKQDGSLDACLFANPADATGGCPAPGSVELRPSESGNDLALAAFVGADLELMTPALPMPTRPRLFLGAEIVPTFASDRNLAGEKNPTCVKGPEPGDVCARDEDPLHPRAHAYGEDGANGQGSVVTTTYDTLSYGANVGVAFPVQAGERHLRIKPSFAWLSYEVEVSGKVVDASCNPTSQCTNTQPNPGDPIIPGSLRETILTGSDTRRFNAIGPGLDVEMDTGRYGPLGTSIFLGGRAYRTLGDRKVEVTTTQIYPNDGLPLAGQAVSARWDAEFGAWMFRIGVGLRVQWLGPKN